MARYGAGSKRTPHKPYALMAYHVPHRANHGQGRVPMGPARAPMGSALDCARGAYALLCFDPPFAAPHVPSTFLRMTWKDQPVSGLTGYPATLGVSCGCTRVLAVKPLWIMERLGPDATAGDAERRMRCGTCKERPRLTLGLDWGAQLSWKTSGGPAPVPQWALEGLE
jgi:hypothetical protein